MPKRSTKASALKNPTKRKTGTQATRPVRKTSGESGAKSAQNRSSKRVTTRGTKPRTAKTVRSRLVKRVTARAAPVRFVAGGPTDHLEKINHIIVLMMENRSFDHMLGYLKLEGSNPNVDGLNATMSNGKYRVGHGSRFFWFDRKTLLSPVTFLDHAASGKLPAVSWIDPNFVDYSVTGPRESNDDHPPSDIMAGQDLALKLYNAVVNSPAWKKTLLLIVYDEHGGFYDHVEPQIAADDHPTFRRFGARVPAIVVSPWVERGKVSHKVFDHTSIIKTILLRFCRRPDGTIPDMGARVNKAEPLGTLLTLSTPREPTPVQAYQHLIERVAQWRADGFKMRTMRQARRQAPEMRKPTEFQTGIEKARQRLRDEGLPEGKP